jgi:UDP-3-O-[3-hydroxymyristoyl] glucosamine N-acyltransferase
LKKGQMKIKDIAILIRGSVDGDGDTDITGLSGLERAQPGDLVFALDEERLALAEKTEASCVLTTEGIRASAKPLLRASNPKLAFILIYNAMNKPVARKAYTDPSATVAASAKIGQNVWIDA